MPKVTNRNRKIPKFVKKLLDILEDPKCSTIVAWLSEGSGFQIVNTSRFIEEVLPSYFRHKNMASFVRQLNMYGFTRPKDSDQHIYCHPRFVKGNMNSIRQIQRKVQEGAEADSEYQIEDSGSRIKAQKHQAPDVGLPNLCQQLLLENQQLKLQNQELNQKLAILNRNKLLLQSMPFLPLLPFEPVAPKICQNRIIGNSEQTQIDKSEEKGQKNRVRSFNLGPNPIDLNRRLSYLALINGAEQGVKEQSDRVQDF